MRLQADEAEIQASTSPLALPQDELSAFFDALPMGLVLADSPSGATIFENDRAREILGGDPASAVSLDERLRRRARHLDGRQLHRSELPIARSLTGAVTPTLHVTLPGPDGATRKVTLHAAPVQTTDGTITGVVVTLDEVPDDQKVERDHTDPAWTAQNAEQVYRTYFDEAADAILVFDSAGRIVDANATATRMLQYTREELLAIRIVDGELLAVDPAWMAPERAELEAVGRWQGELQLRRKDGSLVPIESRVVRIERADGPIYRATCRDITERRAQEQLRDVVQAVVLHELLNPVTALKGQAQILARIGRFDPRTVAAITRQADHLHRLSADLLESARLQAGEVTLRRRQVDLAQVIREAIERARTASPSHALTFEGRGQPVCGSWDHDRLEQIFDNLLSNAIKHTPPGSHVVVTVEEVGHHVRVSVRDDGPGIPPRDMPRLFQRFFRGKAARLKGTDGTGLGLATTKALVEAHGGTIRISSEPNCGATFSFTLPYEPHEASSTTHQELTPRQVDIARLIARGLTNRQIAEELVLAQGTVANHIDHILRRLGFKSRVQIATWAADRGLT